MNPRAPHVAAFFCALIFAGAAAGGCDTRDASPSVATPSPTATASAAPSATGTNAAPFTVANVDSLVNPQRLANATPSEACTRLSSKAGLLKTKLADSPALGRSGLASAIRDTADQFGVFDGLLFGEVHRAQAVFAAAGRVSTTQIDLLVADLDHHLAAAGAQTDKITALNAAVLAFRNSAADVPELRLLASALVVDIADLLSDVQSCSPKS